MRRTREKALELRQPHTPTPLAPATEQPPKGMMDLEAARFWAGRGPGGQPRRTRPPFALKAMDMD